MTQKNSLIAGSTRCLGIYVTFRPACVKFCGWIRIELKDLEWLGLFERKLVELN